MATAGVPMTKRAFESLSSVGGGDGDGAAVVAAAVAGGAVQISRASMMRWTMA